MYILHHDVGAYRACPHTNTLLHGVHTTHSDTTMRVPVGALPADIPLHGVWNTSELANWQTLLFMGHLLHNSFKSRLGSDILSTALMTVTIPADILTFSQLSLSNFRNTPGLLNNGAKAPLPVCK